jgi:hypothetical protein
MKGEFDAGTCVKTRYACSQEEGGTSKQAGEALGSTASCSVIGKEMDQVVRMA